MGQGCKPKKKKKKKMTKSSATFKNINFNGSYLMIFGKSKLQGFNISDE